MAKWVRGLDVAFSRISSQWARDRRAEGYRILIQNLWTGGYENNDRLREVAAPNLVDAFNAGVIIAGYVNASPWYVPAVSVAEAARNAGTQVWDTLRVMAADVEIVGLTEGAIKGTCTALELVGKRVPIYSRAGYWQGMGNPQWPWLKEHKVWEAYYDGDPDVDFGHRRFGPWELSDVIGTQYQGTTVIDGVDVDLNMFDLEYFEEGDVSKIEERLKYAKGLAEELDFFDAVLEWVEELRSDKNQLMVLWPLDSDYGTPDWVVWGDVSNTCQHLKAAVERLEERTRILGRPG